MALWLVLPDDFFGHEGVKIKNGAALSDSLGVAIVVQDRGVRVLRMLAREAASLHVGSVHDVESMTSAFDTIVDSKLNDDTFCVILTVANVFA